MVKYTKGPWYIRSDSPITDTTQKQCPFMNPIPEYVIYGPNYTEGRKRRLTPIIASVWCSPLEAATNARLIEKTPEMFELLNKHLAYMRNPEAIDKKRLEQQTENFLARLESPDG